MKNISVLLTGEYWHPEFQGLLSTADLSLTFRSLSAVYRNRKESDRFDLVVVGQSRPGQFEASQLEPLVNQYVNTPVIVLCGSWCEGESRSGTPVSGLLRIYWHQWQGRFDTFLHALTSDRISSWHLPKIAVDIDRIKMECMLKTGTGTLSVGVSSRTMDGFDMLRDSCPELNFYWIERQDRQDVNPNHFGVVCVEADTLTETTERRIETIQEQLAYTPIVLTLNFPRRQEFARAAQLGVARVLSKPFQVSDLRIALRQLGRQKANAA